jgi:Icc-related predicted phosphoesterase
LHALTKGLVVPDGDVLVIAGDICLCGQRAELKRFNHFLAGLPHPHKVFIAGNHDWPLYHASPRQIRSLVNQATYLQDSGITINGIKFRGSPWQPAFFNWAFNLPIGKALADKWELIPEDTDVLITHGPPYQILDTLVSGKQVGCVDLKQAVERLKPKVHIFGHIHEGYGRLEQDGTTYVNASVCKVNYQPINPPIVVDLNG